MPPNLHIDQDNPSNGRDLPDVYQFAKLGAHLLISSARLLERIVEIGAKGISANPYIANTVWQLGGSSDKHSSLARPAHMTIEELAMRVRYMRAVVRQAAQAALEIRTLIGVREPSSARYFWNDPIPGESIHDLNNQLMQLSEHCEKYAISWKINKEKFYLIKNGIETMLDGGSKHIIVASYILESVEGFQRQTTKIIRAIERNNLLT